MIADGNRVIRIERFQIAHPRDDVRPTLRQQRDLAPFRVPTLGQFFLRDEHRVVMTGTRLNAEAVSPKKNRTRTRVRPPQIHDPIAQLVLRFFPVSRLAHTARNDDYTLRFTRIDHLVRNLGNLCGSDSQHEQIHLLGQRRHRLNASNAIHFPHARLDHVKLRRSKPTLLHVVENHPPHVHAFGRYANDGHRLRLKELMNFGNRSRRRRLPRGSQMTQSIERNHHAVDECEWIDFQLGDKWFVFATVIAEPMGQRDERLKARDKVFVRDHSFVTARPARKNVVGHRRLKQLEHLLAAGLLGERCGDRLALLHGRGEVFRVRPAETGSDDRSEFTRRPNADEQFIAETGLPMLQELARHNASQTRIVLSCNLGKFASHLVDGFKFTGNEPHTAHVTLVGKVRRHDFHDHLLTGHGVEVGLPEILGPFSKHGQRDADRAGRFDQLVDLVFKESVPPFGPGVRDDQFNRIKIDRHMVLP